MLRRLPLVGFLLTAWDSFDQQAFTYRTRLSPAEQTAEVKRVRELLLVAALLLTLGYSSRAPVSVAVAS